MTDESKLPNKAHQGMKVEGYITLESISNVLYALLFISSKVFNVIRKFNYIKEFNYISYNKC